MNTDKRCHRFPVGFVLVAVLAAALDPADLQGADGQAEVRGMTGQAVIVVGDAPAEPLPVGATVSAGTVIKTGRRSAVDLFLGENVGTVRLTQNTILRLDKLSVSESNATRVTEVQLSLDAGSMLGSGNKAGFSVTYQVKVSNGVAAIGPGLYRMDARGYVVLLEGSVIFAHAPPSGEPNAYEMKAPPGVYFSPVEGIRPAPNPLVKEVENQRRANLRTVRQRPDR